MATRSKSRVSRTVAGMASSLEFAARDLCWTADLDTVSAVRERGTTAEEKRALEECKLNTSESKDDEARFPGAAELSRGWS